MSFGNKDGLILALCLMLCVMIGFLSFLFVGFGRHVINGEPNDKIAIWQGTTPPTLPRRLDRAPLRLDLEPEAVRESGLP